MPDGVTGTLDTTAVLLFFALPMSVLVGGALFVPWRRAHWNLSAWAHALARDGWVVAGLVLMLVPEVLESQVDPFLTRHVGIDFTPVAAALDGDLHVRLQALLPQGGLHALFTFAYVAGYPFLIIFTPMLGIWMGRGAMARRALGAYALCYAVALPFYLFAPVQEVWHYDGRVQNVATSYDWVRTHLYSFNEVNNCFPSLHTAISVAMAGVAWHGPSRRYRHLAWLLAAMIVFSTVYLGIHWVVDVAAGLVLAAVAVHLVERWWPDPHQATLDGIVSPEGTGIPGRLL
ncbi:MAG: hypothetical protein QOI63_277 [Thermoplasmata archaeon]|jgi:membrane-associated phospholipid phosphatase|nr:hypothetical protein [Thermoplasmata archaeon]